jgi:hypothetical protein
LRQAQLDARRLEHDAAEARARADRHGAEADRLAETVSVPTGTNSVDMAAQQSATQRLKSHAEDDYQLAVTRARAVERTQQAAGDRASARIRSLSEAPYDDPGLLSKLAHDIADCVDKHADVLRKISNVLKTASAIAGVFSFIPALTPIFAPIAALTAGGALIIDAALVATGHGDWRALTVDAALMALPGAGRIASRAMMSARGGDLVIQGATHALQISKSQRPGTVATLVTRNFGTSAFHGLSRTGEALHPRLQQALDRVPPALRSPFHGKCAEVNAIDKALKAEARVRESVMRTMKVRPVTHAEHETLHKPCRSCECVMREMAVRVQESTHR